MHTQVQWTLPFWIFFIHSYYIDLKFIVRIVAQTTAKWQNVISHNDLNNGNTLHLTASKSKADIFSLSLFTNKIKKKTEANIQFEIRSIRSCVYVNGCVNQLQLFARYISFTAILYLLGTTFFSLYVHRLCGHFESERVKNSAKVYVFVQVVLSLSREALNAITNVYL